VLAQSFARSFYRNAINNGLLALEWDTTGIREGDQLQLKQSVPLPGIMQEILEAGGLVPWVRAGRLVAPTG
jgi:3-isopropylmalate/(R)-2-methylmalate dehydratase small subunit